MSEGDAAAKVDTNWLNAHATWVKSKRHYTVSIFDFPVERLGISPDGPRSNSSAVGAQLTADDLEVRNCFTCRMCGISFEDVASMRSHFRSDSHVSRINGGASESRSADTDNSVMAGAGIGGDTGADAERDSDTDSSGDEPAPRLTPLSHEYVIFPEGAVKKTYTTQDGPRTVFRRTEWQPLEFSVSNAVLEAQDMSDEAQAEGAAKSPWGTVIRTLHTYAINPMWFIVSLRSGRFAGAIFDGKKVVCHKAFRRYTIRAKAGGAQSTNDNTGKRVKSIGSSLRRQGEQALKEDIRGLLRAWATLISNSSLILLSVPKTMRPTLFEEENKEVLDKRDIRIRYVPFMTDKPTFETVQDIHTICSSVYFREVTDMNAPEPDAEPSCKAPVEREPKISVKLSAIKEEDSSSEPVLISCPESVRLFDILRSHSNNNSNGQAKETLLRDLDACLLSIKNAYSNGNIGGSTSIGISDVSIDLSSPVASLSLSREMSLNLSAEEVVRLPGSLDSLWTALHWAADMGVPEAITCLLVAGADPTARDVRGRTPYFLCKTKDARDAFRRYRALAELQWNWAEAGVPEGLTAEMERLQKEKEKEKKKKAKQRKAEQQKEIILDATQAAAAGEAVTTPVSPPKPRAAAAGDCACCCKSLFRIMTTSINGLECCSPECAAKLKRKLAADAAMARFKSSSSIAK